MTVPEGSCRQHASLAARADISSRAIARTLVCLLKVYPMLPSRPLNWVTPRPVIERVAYPSSHGSVEGDLYRPNTPGPHPGVVVCLGVVPFGVDHPQVPRLGEALARSGFAALLYWSPAMRDFRLDPVDVADIASAYEALLARADVDPERSGLLGTCVGGAFALMGAAEPRVRERVRFVCAYAPYASMWTLARDIASASRQRDGIREPWEVDPLTRKVFVHSVTALLDAPEAEPLLGALDVDLADAALRNLPNALQERLDALSPMHYLPDLRAPLVVLLHDRDDPVVPVAESRQLAMALSGRPGVHYTEFTVFKHLDPTRGRPSVPALTRELVRFAHAIYPMFRQTSERTTLRLPGDDLIPGGRESTRAITINAAPEAIWPWLVQMGQDRAGFYSYDWLERLFGAEIHNANRVHPDWQELAVGDTIWPYPERKLRAMARRSSDIGGWKVVSMEPARSLVVESKAGRWTWALVLQPVAAAETRLLARTRFAEPEHRIGRVLDALFGQPAHLVMETGVLRGVKARVERAVRAPGAEFRSTASG